MQRAGAKARIFEFLASIEAGEKRRLLALRAADHEGQAFEQVHVLFVLQKRAVQFRQGVRAVAVRSSARSSFSQSSTSEVDGFFFNPGVSRTS